MGVNDNLNDYNKVRRQLQDAESGFIPTNPSEDLLEAFMGLHKFSVTRDKYGFNILLFDDIGQKIYTYPASIKGNKQWALRIMYLVVSLRNMKETYWKEKDFRKRRKIFSKMNSIKGELNRYEDRYR